MVIYNDGMAWICREGQEIHSIGLNWSVPAQIHDWLFVYCIGEMMFSQCKEDAHPALIGRTEPHQARHSGEVIGVGYR